MKAEFECDSSVSLPQTMAEIQQIVGSSTSPQSIHAGSTLLVYFVKSPSSSDYRAHYPALTTFPAESAIIVPMSWLEFVSSIVGHLLSWPVVALVVALLLLKPLRKLIGRVKTAKALGGEVEFSEHLEDAEKNLDEVLTAQADAQAEAKVDIHEFPRQLDDRSEADAAESSGLQAPDDSRDEPAAPTSAIDPSSDPSGAIIVSWQRLLHILDELNRSVAGPGRPPRSPKAIIAQLGRNAAVSDAFRKSALSLLEARNQVAHGEVLPTPGAARTYVERAAQLESTARGMIALGKMDLEKPMLTDHS